MEIYSCLHVQPFMLCYFRLFKVYRVLKKPKVRKGKLTYVYESRLPLQPANLNYIYESRGIEQFCWLGKTWEFGWLFFWIARCVIGYMEFTTIVRGFEVQNWLSAYFGTRDNEYRRISERGCSEIFGWISKCSDAVPSTIFNCSLISTHGGLVCSMFFVARKFGREVYNMRVLPH